MTPEEYIATLKPPNPSPQAVGEYWGQELGLSPAPNDVERWKAKGVTLADGEVFFYGKLVQAAVPHVTMTPAAADAFLTTVGRLEDRINTYLTPEIATHAVAQIVSQHKKSLLAPPLEPSRAKILNWALEMIPGTERRVAAVRTGLDVSQRNQTTKKPTKATARLLSLIDDPDVKAAAETYLAVVRPLPKEVAAAQRDKLLGWQPGTTTPVTGVPKPRRRPF